MAFSIGFGSGGSPSSGRSITGATSVYTYGMFTYPTGNINLSGSRVVINAGVSLNGSFGGGFTGAGADTSGNVFITSSGAFTTLTGYPGNGFNMVASTGFTWNGGFQGTFFWYTVAAPPLACNVSKVNRDVTVTTTPSTDQGGESVDSYGIQYRSSSDGGLSWSAWGNTQTTGGSYTYSNLTPGLTYQFRNYGNNAAGSSAATVSSNVFISAGGRRWDGSTWTPTTTSKRWNGSSWVDLTISKRWNGSAWVDLS